MSAKIKCTGINQIALVVENLEIVAENYWKILGIGPWAVFDWDAPLVHTRRYGGKPSWARERIALTQVGNVQLELVQPVDGPSLYADALKQQGEGLHHLNFLADDVDKAARVLEAEGFPSLQSGKWGASKPYGAFNYIEIKPLRTIWEPVHMADMDVKPIMIPATEEKCSAPIKCKGINQVAIVVKDLEKVARNYWEIMGIGPWAIYDWEAPLVHDRKYYGKDSWGRERIALAQVGSVQLELVQPVEGPSIYADWLKEHGEGLHHLNFLVDDVDEAAKVLENEGFPSLQSGKWGPAKPYGAFNYIDIKPLRTIWEPVYMGDMGVEPIMVP